MRCPNCAWGFSDLLELSDWNPVSCDGCHKLFHRICLNYELVNVDWDDQPKAYAFCKDCQDIPEFEI